MYRTPNLLLVKKQVSIDGNNFVLHHPPSGEVLRISQAFSEGGGAGVPGAKDGAGPMHVVSYFLHYGVTPEDEAEAEKEADAEGRAGDKRGEVEQVEWGTRDWERETRKNDARGSPAGRGDGVPQGKDTEGVPDFSLSSSSRLESESASSTSGWKGRGRRQPRPGHRRASKRSRNSDISTSTVSSMRTVLLTKEVSRRGGMFWASERWGAQRRSCFPAAVVRDGPFMYIFD